MPPRRSVDDRLAELEAAVEEAGGDELRAVLAKALGDRHYRVVAFAAHVAAERLVYDCLPELLEAYPRFLDKAVKHDPNCLAKKAIMRALYDLDCEDTHFYRAALRYRQMEPVWGGTVDTAADLRSSAAMGLVASGDPRALIEVAELLTDSEAPVRAGAARAIACGNPREAELVLRLKAMTGDDDALVVGECFTGLLSVDPDESIEFVARYLEAEDDAICEAAALALGESRLPAALEHLRAAWDDALVPAWFKRALVRSAAIHRSDEAFEWLLSLVTDVDAAVAADIVDALAIYRHNESLAERLSARLVERGDSALETLFAKVWRR
jgi:HEAT repeat protein